MEHILTLRTASLAVLRSSPAPEGSVVSKLTSEGGSLGTRFSLKECNHTPMNQEELKYLMEGKYKFYFFYAKSYSFFRTITARL